MKLHYSNFFIFILVLFSFCSLAQNTIYPKGIYMNFDELKTLNPTENYDLEITKVDSVHIKFYGGNDYNVRSISGDLSGRFIKKKIYAVSDGNNTYINCHRLKYQTGFAKISSGGQFILFIGSASEQEMYDKNWFLNCIVHGKIGEISGDDMVVNLHPFYYFRGKTARYLHVLDSNTKQIYKMNSTILKILLQNHLELLSAYEQEANINSVSVILDYMDKLNKISIE